MLTTPRLLQRQQQAYRLRIAISVYPTCIRRPRYGGSRRNIAMPFGVEKLEWCGYPMVKNVWWYVYSFWHNSRTWQTDTHTNTHRMTTWAALMHRIARQKLSVHNSTSSSYRSVDCIGLWSCLVWLSVFQTPLCLRSLWCYIWGDCKCENGKRGTVKNAGVENARLETRDQCVGVENAGPNAMERRKYNNEQNCKVDNKHTLA